MTHTYQGIVTTSTGSFYAVRVGDRLFTCKVKGSFKIKGIRTTNPIAVGDVVTIAVTDTDIEESVGWITEIHPRKNYIIRRSSNLSKQAHILASNLDRALLIVTINYPVTSATFIDRFLATSEAYNIETAIVFNKVDLYDAVEQAELARLCSLYQAIGYPCFEISALKGEGLDALRDYIATGYTLVSGHSGVGKSTLINRLVPEASLRTAAISDAHLTGMHTTTYSTMLALDNSASGFVIDTPGIKGFGTIEFEPEQVGHFFPEIFRYAVDCRFGNCAHIHEPGCAVLEAVEKGLIAASRYKSYLSIYNERDDDKYRNDH